MGESRAVNPACRFSPNQQTTSPTSRESDRSSAPHRRYSSGTVESDLELLDSTSMESEKPSAVAATGESTKECLGWMEWLRGWMYLVYEFLFQRITASHLENPMELPPVNDLTCIITGSTSGIGLQIARQLAQFGAHVVMAVRNPKAAHDLIQTWQNEMSGSGVLLNIEVSRDLGMIAEFT